MGTRNGDCQVMMLRLLAITLLVSLFFGLQDSMAQSNITIDTNKDSFLVGDTVQVSGTIVEGAQGNLVAIEVKNPSGETILVRSVELGTGGTFSLSFKVSDSERDGSYEIIANSQVDGKTVSGSKTISLSQQQVTSAPGEDGGGCLIATATFGSELAPQVQLLREIREIKVINTGYGSSFMEAFNQFYYSFSPTIADWERESPAFKEAVKFTITPLITSLSILSYTDIDSEEEMLGYGIGIILLNVGMYFFAPALLIVKLKSKLKTKKEKQWLQN